MTTLEWFHMWIIYNWVVFHGYVELTEGPQKLRCEVWIGKKPKPLVLPFSMIGNQRDLPIFRETHVDLPQVSLHLWWKAKWSSWTATPLQRSSWEGSVLTPNWYPWLSQLAHSTLRVIYNYIYIYITHINSYKHRFITYIYIYITYIIL